MRSFSLPHSRNCRIKWMKKNENQLAKIGFALNRLSILQLLDVRADSWLMTITKCIYRFSSNCKMAKIQLIWACNFTLNCSAEWEWINVNLMCSFSVSLSLPLAQPNDIVMRLFWCIETYAFISRHLANRNTGFSFGVN